MGREHEQPEQSREKHTRHYDGIDDLALSLAMRMQRLIAGSDDIDHPLSSEEVRFMEEEKDTPHSTEY